jgi:hypothetical protein
LFYLHPPSYCAGYTNIKGRFEMARDEKPTDKGRVKVRVIEFELDGSNQTLRESIRDIVGAIGKSQMVVKQTPAGALTNGSGKASSGFETTHDEDTPDDASDNVIQDVDSEDEHQRPSRRRSPPRTPKIITLDLTSQSTPLVDFCNKLAVESNNERSLAVVYWLKHFGVTTEVSMDHIHTAFRQMKWNTPTDATGPLRLMKGVKYGYIGGGKQPGTYAITHVGENHIHDLMKKVGLTL